jgi:hypothetical protein
MLQITRAEKKSSFDKLVVIRVGPSGELQLVSSHRDPGVKAVAAMLVDTTSSDRSAQVYLRKAIDLSLEEAKVIVDRGLGKEVFVQLNVMLTLTAHPWSFFNNSRSART